jgi:hypothetical protein
LANLISIRKFAEDQLIFVNNRDKYHPEIIARFREKKSEKNDFLILGGPKIHLATFRFRSGPGAWLTM